MTLLPSAHGQSGRHDAAPSPRPYPLATARPAPEETPAIPAPAERPRMLVVEKDPAMGTLLTRALALHYQVNVVSDSLMAWDVARSNPPALVVIDLYAPGTDSLILTRSLRAGTYMEKLPIILLASSADRELLLRCLAAGASNFLLKPFGMVELLAFVQVELALCASRSPDRATPHEMLRERYA